GTGAGPAVPPAGSGARSRSRPWPLPRRPPLPRPARTRRLPRGGWRLGRGIRTCHLLKHTIERSGNPFDTFEPNGRRLRRRRRDPRRAADGSDWLTDPQTQIRWGEDYIPEPVRHPGPGLGLLAGTQVLRAAASRCSWG